jgi:hypothetical protein
MRLIPLSVALLTLTISGCALTSPFAKRTPEEIYRDRLFADAKAQFERGNPEAGQRILDQLRAESDSSLADSDSRDSRTEQASFQQNLPGTSQQEYDELVEMLVAMQPLSERARKREYYRRLTAAQLRQMLSSYESTHLIGQNQLQRLQGVPESNDARTPSTMIAGRTPPRATTAPDPRQSPHGIASPWPTQQQSGAGPTGFPTTADRQLALGGADPTANPALSRVQPVKGVVPAGGGQTVSPIGTVDSSLPIINPGNGGAGLPQIYPAGSAPSPSPGTIIQSSGVRAPRQTTQAPVQLLSPFGQQQPTQQPQQFSTTQPTTTQPGFSNQQGQPVLQPPGQLQSQMTVPGRISEGVQNILPTLRGAANRLQSTIPQLGGAGDPVAVPANPVVQQADVNLLIAQLESQLAASAPGETEAERLDYARRHVNLRLLYLIAGRGDQALEPIQGIDANHQEFWQQLVWSMATYFDAAGQPQASQRATQTVNQLRTAITRLKAGADLDLRNVSFCHKIVSFGNYERFSRDQFTPGQPVLLYAEVENFKSTMVDSDRFRTALKSTIEIHKAGVEGKPLEAIEFPVTEDLCRNYRRDYFHSYEFSVPQKVEPGLYTLVLKVTDQLGQKTAVSSVNFEVE